MINIITDIIKCNTYIYFFKGVKSNRRKKPRQERSQRRRVPTFK